MSFESGVFVENEAIGDAEPNLMMHRDEASDANENNDQARRRRTCVFGHQVRVSNDSFHFKYGACGKRLPFICVKPLPRVEHESSSDTDRCAAWSVASGAGGNWIESDHASPGSPPSPTTVQLSHSQKCCMYNVHWQAEFDAATRACASFDAHVYSFKLTHGYKRILARYAAYLNANYHHGGTKTTTTTTTHGDEYLDFWTSCLSARSQSVLSELDCRHTSSQQDARTQSALLATFDSHHDEENDDDDNDNGASGQRLQVAYISYESPTRFALRQLKLSSLMSLPPNGNNNNEMSETNAQMLRQALFLAKRQATRLSRLQLEFRRTRRQPSSSSLSTSLAASCFARSQSTRHTYERHFILFLFFTSKQKAFLFTC